ncbi:TolB family protein [Pimelobacter simplex]|uniref:TolB family protein n=1 Tax=Nocardioides simplex TaxID=2045 RepID=UPI00193389DF|nr:PD40 domain-containing protein [Pimelobacter simplex]
MVLRRILPLVVVVALSLLAGPVPWSSAAARPTVRVSLSGTDVAVGTTVVATARVRGGTARQRVTLQRRAGSTWTKVAARLLPRHGALRKVRFPITAMPGTTTYRVVLARHGSTPGRRGRAFTVTGRTAGGPAVPEPPSTRLVSHRSTGATTGSAESGDPSISADGRFVVFESFAADLLPGGNNGVWQVYLWDRTTDALTLISHRADGTPGLGHSKDPVVSADGRYVAFVSGANQLGGVPGVGPDSLWRWDRTTDVLQRLTGDNLDQSVTNPSISADGSAIAFMSAATTIAGPGAAGVDDIFRWHEGSGFTLVSHGAGVAANGPSLWPAISADGDHVAYESLASNLVAAAGGQTDGNGRSDVFLWDASMIATTEPVLVSTAHGGLAAATGGTAGAFWPTLSADGSLVAYETDATNVLPVLDGDTNKDVFVWSRDTPATQVLVSRPTGGGAGTTSAYNASMSADGSSIAFLSDPLSLTGTGTFLDAALLWTRATGQLTNLSPGVAGNPDSGARSVVLAGTGVAAVFTSAATDLVGGTADANGEEDVFVRAPIG